jgi:hypothetical protein
MLLIIMLGIGCLLAACATSPGSLSSGQQNSGTPNGTATIPQAAATDQSKNITPTKPAIPTQTPKPTLGDSETAAPTQSPVPTMAPGAMENMPPAVIAARDALAKMSGIPVAQVEVVSYEAVDWPDGCLGVRREGILCTQVITPGYRVMMNAKGQPYEFHTDESGRTVLPASSDGTSSSIPSVQVPDLASTALFWQQTEDGVCTTIQVSGSEVSYGRCNSALTKTELAEGRSDQLETLVSQYSTFSATTKSGLVRLNGTGKGKATNAEMRSIAEWARLVWMEAQGGRTGAAWGLAFSWHREGGIAGFCDDLAVYLNGWAMPTSCKATQPQGHPGYRLSADQIEQLYQYIDQFSRFEVENSDGAVADSMKTTLQFEGQGTVSVNDSQKEEIQNFAAEIYTAAVRQ